MITTRNLINIPNVEYMFPIFLGSEVDPDKFGIVGHRGAKNRQPFLTGFFKASQKVNLRKTRAAERYKRQAMQDMSADEPETPAYRYASRFLLYIN